MAEVNHVRKDAIFPTIRAKYQILGDTYRERVLHGWRFRFPRVHAQMEKRAHFCDFLMLTGIFTDRELDSQHEDLRRRILNELLQLAEEREQRYWYGDSKAKTQYSEKLLSVDFNALSQAAHKDGHALHF